MSRMVFSWVMEDMLAGVRGEWRVRSCGMLIGEERFQQSRWADDNWLFATSAAELSYMVNTLDEAANMLAGIELRVPQCQWKRIQRQWQDMPELPATEARSSNMLTMQETPPGT